MFLQMNTKKFRFLPHTADRKFQAFGKTLEEVLKNSALALFNIIYDKKISENKKFKISVKGKDLESLMYNFLEEFLAIYEKTWIDDWYASRKEHDEYKQKGKKALTEFYKKIEKDIPVPKYLERPFNLKIEDDGDEYTIKGVIDRIDHLNGGIEIIDYKTGQGRTEKNFSAEDKEQLLIYQLAATQVLGEKVENLSFYYVEVGNKVSFLGTEKELKAIEKKIINTIKEIKKGKFPPKPGKICDWCDFKNICEYRAL